MGDEYADANNTEQWLTEVEAFKARARENGHSIFIWTLPARTSRYSIAWCAMNAADMLAVIRNISHIALEMMTNGPEDGSKRNVG